MQQPELNEEEKAFVTALQAVYDEHKMILYPILQVTENGIIPAQKIVKKKEDESQ